MSIISTTPQKQSTAFSGLVVPLGVPVVYTTAAGITYTYQDLFSGFIMHDPGGGVNDTLPAASLLVPQLHALGGDVGSFIDFEVRNTADANETITVVVGTGVTISGTATVTQNSQKRFRAIITALGDKDGNGATYTVYSMGTVTF